MLTKTEVLHELAERREALRKEMKALDDAIEALHGVHVLPDVLPCEDEAPQPTPVKASNGKPSRAERLRRRRLSRAQKRHWDSLSPGERRAKVRTLVQGRWGTDAQR